MCGLAPLVVSTATTTVMLGESTMPAETSTTTTTSAMCIALLQLSTPVKGSRTFKMIERKGCSSLNAVKNKHKQKVDAC